MNFRCPLQSRDMAKMAIHRMIPSNPLFSSNFNLLLQVVVGKIPTNFPCFQELWKVFDPPYQKKERVRIYIKQTSQIFLKIYGPIIIQIRYLSNSRVK